MNNSHVWSSKELITASKLNALAELSLVNSLSTDLTSRAKNVKSFGAVGDGVSDDTTAIQSALDSFQTTGGILFMPQGNYKISKALKIYQGTTIQGAGIAGRLGDYKLNPGEERPKPGTNIIQSSPNENGIMNAEPTVYNITLQDLVITGAGSGTGNGIYFDWAINGQDDNGRLSHLQFERIFVTDFGNNGIELHCPILTTLINVHSQNNGNNGFELLATGFSNSFINTWAANNKNIGYHAVEYSYTSFVNCAADYNDIGYQLEGCQNASLLNSGAERQLTRALNIIGSNLINVFGFEVVGNNDTAIYVDQNSFGIHIFGAADNSVNATAKVFIHASWGAQIVTSAINTSDQAPNQYDDWSYVTELTNSQGYFAVSPHKGIVNGHGVTSDRPSGTAGLQWFDQTLGKPIWHNGTNWVDSTGKIV